MGTIYHDLARSSILPLLLTVIISEAPTIALLYHLLSRDLLPALLPPLILITNLLSLAVLLVCVYTDPGILPQLVNHYESSEELLYLPPVNHHLRFEHNYLQVGPWGLATLQKYCVECHIYRPTRTIHCKECNHCV